MSAAPLRLWLLGSAVSGSFSPVMQEAAMRAMGVEGWYRARDVDEAGFAAAVEALRRGEADGANVTIPHKRAAAEACDRLVGDALLLRAANTLVTREGLLEGHNTDTSGLEAALREEGMWPGAAGTRGAALLVGAGGAAVAAGLVLLRAGAAPVVVVARRPDAAAHAAAMLRAAVPGAVVEAGDLGGVASLLAGAAWLVNATPAGLGDLALDPGLLPASARVVDLRYRPRPVDLVAAARAAGLRACDGLEMLLRQGMESLRLWTGREPAVEAGRAALRAAVGE